MIPENRLSTTPLTGAFLFPREEFTPFENTESYEYGGVAINNASQGLLVKPWRGRLVGSSIVLDADGQPETTVVIEDNIEEFNFTFDQNMRPFVAYVAGGVAKYRWYDGTVPGYVTTTLGANVITPRCTMDDKRPLQVGASDIILAYVREGSLLFRTQRERYLIERTLTTGVEYLDQIGMSTVGRLQFRVKML